MKKMVYLVLCCFYLLQANGANYQVRLVGLDAELNQGNGSFQSDILHYSSGKLLETKFNNLSTKKEKNIAYFKEGFGGNLRLNYVIENNNE